MLSSDLEYRTGDGCLPTADDSDCFDVFVRRHRRPLVRFASALCGSDCQAEDLVQDVLARLYPRWHRLIAQGSPLAYARRSIANEHVSWRRRWATRHIQFVEPGQLREDGVDPWANRHDDDLWQRLLRLPPRQRSAVVLRYYERLDDAEIADILGCRPVTVRAHVSRGLAALRASTRFDAA